MCFANPLAGEQSPKTYYAASSSGFPSARSVYLHSLSSLATVPKRQARSQEVVLTHGYLPSLRPHPRALETGFPSAAVMSLELHSHPVLFLQVPSGVRQDFPGGRLLLIRKCWLRLSKSLLSSVPRLSIFIDTPRYSGLHFPHSPPSQQAHSPILSKQGHSATHAITSLKCIQSHCTSIYCRTKTCVDLSGS